MLHNEFITEQKLALYTLSNKINTIYALKSLLSYFN